MMSAIYDIIVKIHEQMYVSNINDIGYWYELLLHATSTVGV